MTALTVISKEERSANCVAHQIRRWLHGSAAQCSDRAPRKRLSGADHPRAVITVSQTQSAATPKSLRGLLEQQQLIKGRLTLTSAAGTR